jgi:hypothetical protein
MLDRFARARQHGVLKEHDRFQLARQQIKIGLRQRCEKTVPISARAHHTKSSALAQPSRVPVACDAVLNICLDLQPVRAQISNSLPAALNLKNQTPTARKTAFVCRLMKN